MDSSSGAKRGGAPLDALSFDLTAFDNDGRWEGVYAGLDGAGAHGTQTHIGAFDNNRNTAGKEDSRRFRRRRSSRNADTYRRSLETLSTLCDI